MINVKCNKKNGEVVGMKRVGQNDEIILVTNTGRTIRFNSTTVPIHKRGGTGVKLMGLNTEEEKISGVGMISEVEGSEGQRQRTEPADGRRAGSILKEGNESPVSFRRDLEAFQDRLTEVGRRRKDDECCGSRRRCLGHRLLLTTRKQRSPCHALGLRAGACRTMEETRENTLYLPGFDLSRDMAFTSDPRAAVEAADTVVLATPSFALRPTLARIADRLRGKRILILTKGLKTETFSR